MRTTRWTGQDKQARVCSLHFTDDDYENLRQFQQGFASRLILKAGAVPRVFGDPDFTAQEVAAFQGVSEREKRVARRRTKQVSVPACLK